MQIPITELSNIKSENIDLLDIYSTIKTLHECEYEIFGNSYGDGIFDKNFLHNLSNIKDNITNILCEKKQGYVVLVGAGTSGRLCKMISDIHNNSGLNKKLYVIPLLSGGSDSLIAAQVNAEDNWSAGYQDISGVLAGINISSTIVIGVTCGLSSSYVAGSLEASINLGCKTVTVLGFNSRESSTMQFSNQDLIKNIVKLNPIVGPEAICGSVRMKSGTATIIILSALLLSKLDKKTNNLKQISNKFLKLQNKYQLSHNRIYDNLWFFEKGAVTLRQGGRIFYLTKGFTSYLCLYDAVECYPTFGAELGQINTFVDGGIEFFNQFGYDNFQKSYNFNLNDFIIKDQLTHDDLCILSGVSLEDLNLSSSITNTNTIELQKLNNVSTFEGELVLLRSLLSYFSTYSFIQAGKIYGNMMIDVKITNKKLYLRACRIIAEILNIDGSESEQKIINTINIRGDQNYMKDISDLEQIIDSGSKIKNVVAKTILLHYNPLETKFAIENMITKEPIIRKLINSITLFKS